MSVCQSDRNLGGTARERPILGVYVRYFCGKKKGNGKSKNYNL